MPRRRKTSGRSEPSRQFERSLLARQMSATDDERVLSVLQDLLPADTAAALHEHARELMQRRARAASAPVDEALRACVAALESQAVELADAIQKQRGDAPEWASQRLDEEQRRALSALLTADALQPPPEALPPPTPDSQLLLNAQRCQGSEERTLSALETLQASTGASSSLLQKLTGLGAEGLTSDATHQAIVRTRPSNPSPDPKADASHQAIVAIAVSAPTPRRPTTRLGCRAWPAAATSAASCHPHHPAWTRASPKAALETLVSALPCSALPRWRRRTGATSCSSVSTFARTAPAESEGVRAHPWPRHGRSGQVGARGTQAPMARAPRTGPCCCGAESEGERTGDPDGSLSTIGYMCWGGRSCV